MRLVVLILIAVQHIKNSPQKPWLEPGIGFSMIHPILLELKLAVVNLGIHAAFGLATPPGLGLLSSVLRPAWTAGNWFYCTFKGDRRKRRIHSPRVMLVSALYAEFPLSGIPTGAYLLSIMEESPNIGLAITDNMLAGFTGRSLEEVLGRIGSGALRPLVRGYSAVSETRLASGLQGALLGRNTKTAHDALLGYLMNGAHK